MGHTDICFFCIIINSNADDADIQREIINMFIRTNILIRKFSKCCIAVRVTMFKAYCLCLYDAVLWKQYNIGRLHSIKCGHVIIDALNYFWGFKRRDILGIPSFDTVLANAACSFEYLWTSCRKHIVVNLRDLMGQLCFNDVL